MGDSICYWEYYVDDDHRRRYESKIFKTKEDSWSDLKTQMQNVSGSYRDKVILKVYTGKDVTTMRLRDVNFK